MIHFSREIIDKLDKVSRLNLINSVTGFKPANLIGTISKQNQENLAIFSSLVHLGSKPPLLGLITRPNSVPRHTYTNIIESKFYTINHVSDNIIERAHMTSAKFNRDPENHLAPGILCKSSITSVYVLEWIISDWFQISFQNSGIFFIDQSWSSW